MTLIPGAAEYIQKEEVAAYAPVSESTLYKYGQTNNYLLDHYPMPPGMIIDFAGPESSVPNGFLVCDGRTFSRTTYADLFATIGTLWGIGDGITTANTPDFRGLFSRMVDHTTVGSAGRDPDAAGRTPIGTGTAAQPGSYEADQFGAHTHSTPFPAGGSGFVYQSSGDAGDGHQTGGAGGNETRPKNLYVLKLIKT